MGSDIPGSIAGMHRPEAMDNSLIEELWRFPEMFERASIGLLAIEIPGYRITAANQALCTLMGYTREELVGADADAIFRHGGPWDRTPTDRLLAGEIDSYVVEREFPCKDDHLEPVLDTVCAVHADDGSVRHLLVLVQQQGERRAAEAGRRRSQLILETAIASSRASVATFDRDLRFTLVAGGGVRYPTLDAGTFVGRDVREVPHNADTLVALEAALQGHESTTRSTFRGRIFSSVHAPLREAGREITGVVTVTTDITDDLAAEAAGSHNRDLLNTVLTAVPMLVASLNVDGCLLDVAGRLFEQSVLGQAAVGKRLDQAPGFSAAAALIDRAARGEEALATVEHQGRFYQSYYSPSRDADGEVTGVLAVITDVSERHLAEQRAVFTANHDVLTGLLSRAALLDHIDTLLGSGAEPVSIVVVDLDKLQVINDSLGHQVGDGVIGKLARRLTAVLPGLTMARTGGDEITVVVPGSARMTEAHEVAAKVHDALTSVIRVGEHTVTMTASIGIAFAPAGGSSADLIRDADSALHDAKRSGRGEIRAYAPESRRRIQRQLAIEVGLRSALHNEDLRLVYQPIVTLPDRRIVGAEALLRWDDISGPVPPAEFIPIAEASGLIVPMGAWVMQRACLDMAPLYRDHDSRVSVSVNVSVGQLMTGDFSGWVDGILASSGLPAAALIVEVTESAFLDDLAAVRVAFERLRRDGVRIAIDDFGTGFSSLSRLQGLPVDIIKLDRAFVTDVADRPGARTMAAAIYELSRAIGASIVAEGIETEAQAATLAEIGYEHAQGFLFSRPMPLPQLHEFVRHHGRAPVIAAPTS